MPKKTTKKETTKEPVAKVEDKAPEVKPKYTITVNLGDGERTGTGETVLEALQAVHKPVKIFTKTFVTITDGKRTKEMMFMPLRAKRLFYPHAQVYVARELEFLLK